MPTWQWSAPRKSLPWPVKHFLAFIWYHGDHGCREWNYRLAKRFKVCPRTIQLWIRRLLDLGLVNVQWTRTRHRTIYRMPFFKKTVWETYYKAHHHHLPELLRPPRKPKSANCAH